MGESPHVTPNKMVASYYIPQEKCLRGVGLAHGMWLDNPAMVERAVNNVIEKRPAAALLLGDLVYHTVSPEGSEIDQVALLGEPLGDAGIPAYAVPGNRDYSLP